MKIGLDTNILLRWLMAGALTGKEDIAQAALVGDLMSTEGDHVFVNQIVLVETIWVLKRKLKLDRASLANVVNRVLHSALIVQEADIVTSALDMYALYPGDFSDHLIAALNRNNGCSTTMTFDKAAAKSPYFSELQR